jgi:hypothetical protein
MAPVLADHPDYAFSAHDLAFAADFFYRSPDLHDPLTPFALAEM